MVRLSLFESGAWLWISQSITGPARALNVAALTVAIVLAAAYAVGCDRLNNMEQWKKRAVGWSALLALWLLTWFGGMFSNTNILAVAMTVGAMIHLSVATKKRIVQHRASWKKAILFVPLILFPLLWCYAAFFCSHAYWLPASYPPRERAQLRMIRRIVEVEPHGVYQGESPIPLEQAILIKGGRNLIPESIRIHHEYRGYIYTLRVDNPSTGLFTLDAVPKKYQPGMYSFHAFCVYQEPPSKQWDYLIYCISMADRAGKPATSADRHFHDRTLVELISSWLRDGEN